MKKCFIKLFDKAFVQLSQLDESSLVELLKLQVEIIAERGEQEKLFLNSEIQKIESYTKEEAIAELLRTKKISEKLLQIDTYIKGLQV